MDKDNIALIGFMGAGKSLVSKELGNRLGKKVFSSDEMIEAQEKRSIPDIFKDSGEAHFRQVESQIVDQMIAQHGVIFDCGGGIVLNPENWQRIQESAVTIYLSASPENLYKNIQLTHKRPLLEVEDPLAKIKELLAQRDDLYKRADHILDVNGQSVSDVAETIEGIFKNE